VTALDPAMVIICRESDGRWYVTFTAEAADPEPREQTGHAIGVDLGVTDFAVTSDGQRTANPRHLERKARSLARYQRRLARCQKGAANRARAAAKGSPGDACGAGVRHPGSSRVRPAVKQESRPVTAGILVLQGGE